jgi:hypothetical protein
MKNFILSFCLCFLSLSLFAQARLGFTASDIRKEFGAEHKIESNTTDDGTYYLSIDMGHAFVIYYFDKQYICNICLVIPANQKMLNYYVQMHNEEYVIVSSTEWKMYTEHGISNIKLIMDGEYTFFRWTIE